MKQILIKIIFMIKILLFIEIAIGISYFFRDIKIPVSISTYCLILLTLWLWALCSLFDILTNKVRRKKAFRDRQQKAFDKLFEQVKSEWFPKGKYAFFLYSNNKKWETYFKEELIPKIQDKTHIWNWSTLKQDGWKYDLLEAKILDHFRPKRFFYPIAIVFSPTKEARVFPFFKPYLRKLRFGKDDYDKLEAEFLTFLSSVNNV